MCMKRMETRHRSLCFMHTAEEEEGRPNLSRTGCPSFADNRKRKKTNRGTATAHINPLLSALAILLCFVHRSVHKRKQEKEDPTGRRSCSSGRKNRKRTSFLFSSAPSRKWSRECVIGTTRSTTANVKALSYSLPCYSLRYIPSEYIWVPEGRCYVRCSMGVNDEHV